MTMTATITALEIEETLTAQRDEEKRKVLMRFFRTGAGQYGEGNEFLGIKVPQTRSVVKEAKRCVPFYEIAKLLHNRWHEVRLAGFLLLVEEMNAALPVRGKDSTERVARRKEIADFYLAHARQANNWDLVDLSAPKVIGAYLYYSATPDYTLLTRLAESDNLWEQRISIVSTLYLIQQRVHKPALILADKLIAHPHDLIHKAIGWMLREVGKRDKELLIDFLEENYNRLPRTSLRYAIERFPEKERLYWLKRP